MSSNSDIFLLLYLHFHHLVFDHQNLDFPRRRLITNLFGKTSFSPYQNLEEKVNEYITMKNKKDS